VIDAAVPPTFGTCRCGLRRYARRLAAALAPTPSVIQ